jgi:hypothetical protein
MTERVVLAQAGRRASARIRRALLGQRPPPIEAGCCEDPRPRILTSSGRVFCASCRQYLDDRPATTPDEPEATQAEESTDDAADQEGDPE